MPVDFCMFTDQEGNNVRINSLLVSYFQSSPFSDDEDETTRTILDDEHSLSVYGTPSEVEMALTIEEDYVI